MNAAKAGFVELPLEKFSLEPMDCARAYEAS